VGVSAAPSSTPPPQPFSYPPPFLPSTIPYTTSSSLSTSFSLLCLRLPLTFSKKGDVGVKRPNDYLSDERGVEEVFSMEHSPTVPVTIFILFTAIIQMDNR